MCVSRSLGGRAEGLVILSCNSRRSNLAKCRNLSKGKKGRKMPLLQYGQSVTQSVGGMQSEKDSHLPQRLLEYFA
jgi:hypothetical protein